MMFRPRAWKNWLLVVVFAAGMAWVEAACVYYLRAMVDRLEPYQPNPLPMHGVLGPVELVREAATLVMLLAVGGIAGRTRITRLGFGRDAMDRIANHKSSTVTDVYDRHSYAEEDRRIMAAVARHVIEIVEGTAGVSNVMSLR